MKQYVTLLCYCWLLISGSLYGQSHGLSVVHNNSVNLMLAGTNSISNHIIKTSSTFSEDIPTVQDSSSKLESSILDNIDKSTLLSNPYPNPARSYTQIDYELPEKLEGIEIKVLSLIGNEVVTKELTDLKGTIRIDTDQLNSGVYFIYLKNSEKFITSRKLIVSN